MLEKGGLLGIVSRIIVRERTLALTGNNPSHMVAAVTELTSRQESYGRSFRRTKLQRKDYL